MSSPKVIPKVLIVDDEPSNGLLLERVIGKLECEAIYCKDGWSAIQACKGQVFALILLDVLMPEINGYETLVRIKASTLNRETPVFFITGMETDQELLIKAYKAGAVDFILKPLNLNILRRKVNYFIKFFNQKQALKEAQEKAEGLMKARMSLVAHITHELRTPLFGMMGMIDAFKEEPLNEHQVELVNKMEQNSLNLLDTVNEFLDFAKTEEEGLQIQNEYFNLRQTSEDLIQLMRFQYHSRESVNLKFFYDNEIEDFVRADKKKIRHILLNLLSNSLKFTKKGHVSLEIRYIGKKEDKKLVKFIVSDTGIGIPLEKQESIFKEFSQVESTVQDQSIGTGLGLAICKKLLTSLDGKMKVKSVEGEGTSFSFSIPIEEGGESEISEVKSSESFQELIKDKKVKVLVVDDVPDNLFVIKNYLNLESIEYDLIESPIEANKILKSKTFDIVFLDISMPERDGFEVAKIFRSECSDKEKTHLVALTAFGMEPEFQKKLDESGFDDYLMKPIRKEEILQKIAYFSLNLGSDEDCKVGEVIQESSEPDYNFDQLDDDFLDYLPTYLEHKLQEVNAIIEATKGKEPSEASSYCHKILGTAKSFGLFKIHRDLEELQSLLKKDFEGSYEQILTIGMESQKHLKELMAIIEEKTNLNHSQKEKKA